MQQPHLHQSKRSHAPRQGLLLLSIAIVFAAMGQPPVIMTRLLLASFLAMLAQSTNAATTINAINKYAYGANVGWMDGRSDPNNGMVIGEYVCSGAICAANVGWIHLGNGAPTNGIYYQNVSANDFGVNHDGSGNLRGYAWGANIGWINFESTGAPRIDLKTGQVSGSVYSANCGWISLSNAFAFVQTDTIAAGTDSDANSLPDAWERLNFEGIGINPDADDDDDGMSNQQEYRAGTNPNDANDRLAITQFATTPGGTSVSLAWQSVGTRCYTIENNLDLNSATWLDSGLGLIAPDGLITTRVFADTNAPMRFYRVRAVRPLMP